MSEREKEEENRTGAAELRAGGPITLRTLGAISFRARV